MAKKNKRDLKQSEIAAIADRHMRNPNPKDAEALANVYLTELIERRTKYDPSVPFDAQVFAILKEREMHFDTYLQLAHDFVSRSFPDYKKNFGLSPKFTFQHMPKFTPFTKKPQVLPFAYSDEMRQEFLTCEKFPLAHSTTYYGSNGKKTEECTFYVGMVRSQLTLFREVIYRKSHNEGDHMAESGNSYSLQAIISCKVLGVLELMRADYIPTSAHPNKLVDGKVSHELVNIFGTHQHTLSLKYSILFPAYSASCDAEEIHLTFESFDDMISHLRKKQNIKSNENGYVVENPSYPILDQFKFYMKKRNNVIEATSNFVPQDSLPTQPKKLSKTHLRMYLHELSHGHATYDLVSPFNRETTRILQHRIDNFAQYEEILDNFIKNSFAIDYKTNYAIKPNLSLQNFPVDDPFSRNLQKFSFPFDDEFREECIGCKKYLVKPEEVFTKKNKVQKTKYYCGVVNGQVCLFQENIRYKVDENKQPLPNGYSYSLSMLLKGENRGYMELLRADYLPLSAHPNKTLAHGELNTVDNVNLYSAGQAGDIMFGSHLHKPTKQYCVLFPAYMSASNAIDINKLVKSYQEMVTYASHLASVQTNQPFMVGKPANSSIVDIFNELYNTTENTNDDEDN